MHYFVDHRNLTIDDHREFCDKWSSKQGNTIMEIKVGDKVVSKGSKNVRTVVRIYKNNVFLVSETGRRSIAYIDKLIVVK